MSDTVQKRPQEYKVFLQRLRSPWTLIIVLPILVALFDLEGLEGILTFAVEAFAGTLPFIIVAVLLIAYLKAAGAEALVAAAFKGRETRMIFFAAFLGGLAPFCSCEVIPFIAGLLALGAPISAVMAFWLASPLVDPASLLITAAALGWPFAIAKTVSAVALGIFGGFAMKFIMGFGLITDPLRPNTTNSSCGCGPSPFDGKPVWKFWTETNRQSIFVKEGRHNFLFLIKWLALAYILQALLVTYVPADLIASVVGGEGIVPIVLSALVGMPAYLNGYVAPALLAGLMEQGMSGGAALSFMIAGAVSCIPAMAAVWSLVRVSVFASYVGLGLVGAVLSGIIFQMTL
jgi:uncharacterized protein